MFTKNTIARYYIYHQNSDHSQSDEQCVAVNSVLQSKWQYPITIDLICERATQCTVETRNSLQHTVHCNTLLTATHCSLQPTVHCNTLLTATHCSLQHTAHCNTLFTATHCSLQHTAHCNTLLTATHCSLQHTATHNALSKLWIDYQN